MTHPLTPREKVERVDLDGGDLDSGGSLDDLAISGELINMLRLERMDTGVFWGRIYMKNGPDYVLGFHVSKRALMAEIRHD